MRVFLLILLISFSRMSLNAQDSTNSKYALKNSDLKRFWEMKSSLPKIKGSDKGQQQVRNLLMQHPDSFTKVTLLGYYNKSAGYRQNALLSFFIGVPASFIPVIITAPIVTGKTGELSIPTQEGFQFALVGIAAGAIIRTVSFAIGIKNMNLRKKNDWLMEYTWDDYVRKVNPK